MFMQMNCSASLAHIENSYRFNLNNLGSGNFIVNYKNWYKNTLDLLRVLISQGEYEASEKLCAHVIERVGLDDLDSLAVQRFQAEIWYHQEKWSESCNMFCKLLKDLDSFGGYNVDPFSLRDLFYDLGLVQEKMGEDLEALKAYRKCLEVEIRLYGLQHQATLVTCRYIGDCYERLGRYEDTLRFYRKVGERLRNILSPDHTSVKMVEEWSEWTQGNMEEAYEKSGIVADTDRDEDTDYQGIDMEDVNSGANQEMVEEMDCDNDSDCHLSWNKVDNKFHDDAEGDALHDFDWDKFLDYPTPSFYGFD
jgi:tetratricopeptide (TPR) repeat protein